MSTPTTSPPPSPLPTYTVGTLFLVGRTKYGFSSRGVTQYLFSPHDSTLPPLRVGCSLRGDAASSNVLALVRAVPSPPRAVGDVTLGSGELHIVLGPVGDMAAELEALTYEATPYPPYPDANKPKGVWIRAALEHATIAIEEASQNRDLVNWPCTFSIDNVTTLDVDDVVSIRRSHSDGGWDFAVTIADVATIIPINSPIDAAAHAAGETLYTLVGSALRPMLPREFSENLSSLLPGHPRLGLSLFFTWDGQDNISSLRFAPTLVTTARKLDYESAVTVAAAAGWSDEMDALSRVARVLGVLMAVPEDLGVDAHTWVQALMLWYNINAGEKLKTTRTGGLLRAQAAPDATSTARAASLSLIDPALATLAYLPARYCAVDDAAPAHYALKAQAYAHASSPLRRYADLENQRALLSLPLRAPLNGNGAVVRSGECDVLADHLNNRRRATKKYSRDSTFLAVVDPRGLFTARAVFVDFDDGVGAVADDPEVGVSAEEVGGGGESEGGSSAATAFYAAMAKTAAERGLKSTRASFWVASWGRWVALRVVIVSEGEGGRGSVVLSRDETSEFELKRGAAYQLTGFADLRARSWRRSLRFTIAPIAGQETAKLDDWAEIEGETIY